MAKTSKDEILYNYEGTEYHGTYNINSGVVRVVTPFGEKSTHTGGSPALVVARMLFREILDRGKKGDGGINF